MSKLVLAALAIGVIVVGCVNISGPSTAPSITPPPATPPATVASTATPSAAPSIAAPTPAPTPTTAPTLTAAPTEPTGPTPIPTSNPGFDQRDVIFGDDLSDVTDHCTTGPASDPPVFPDDCWGVGTTDGGTIAYGNGSLNLDTTAPGAWMFSRRVADTDSATMRVIGDFYPTNEGRFGVLCASGDDKMFGALVGTDGSWAMVKLGNNGAEKLFGDDAAGLNVVPDQSNLVALECAGTATGALRLTLWLGKSGPVATWTQPNGATTFDRAATYIESAGDAFSVRMDNVVVFGSRISDGSLSPAAAELLTHVPTDWQDTCYEGLRPPYLASTGEAVLTCFVSTSNVDGAEIAEYAAFLTPDAMQAAYQSRINAFGSGAGVGSCADGSGEHTYGFEGGQADVGRLLCVEQFSGIRFDWTDTRLNILGSLVDFDGSYPKTFADWVNAGPNL